MRTFLMNLYSPVADKVPAADNPIKRAAAYSTKNVYDNPRLQEWHGHLDFVS